MRRPLYFALVLGVAAAVVATVAVTRDDDPPTAVPPGAVYLLGDSLNVGIEPFIGRYLPGWRIDANNESGRPTEVGVEELRSARSGLAPALAISLGTNDDPGSVEAFQRSVRTVLRIAGPKRCVAWLTIARDGDAYEGFNEILRREARATGALVVVDWEKMVDDHPEWLGPDGIHATSEGYAQRARSVAHALRECTEKR